MKELVSAIAVCFLIAGSYPASGPTKQDAAPEAVLDGAWELVAIEYGFLKDREQLPVERQLIERIIVIRNGNLAIPDLPERRLWRLKMDAAKRPGQLDVLDVIETVDNAKGMAPLKCIYSLKKDTLKIMFHFGVIRVTGGACLDPEAPRPMSFDDAERPHMTLTFQRLAN